MSKPNFKPLALLILLAVLFAACGGAPAEPTATLAAVEVITPATETPTPQPGLVVLLAPEGADAELAAQAGSLLQAYAAERGLLYEQQAALDAAALPANLVAVAALAPTSGLAELADAAPQARFVALGYDPAGQAANLSMLALTSADAEAAAFLAGYTAAISTDDWRVGALYAAGEDVLANAFVAGAVYFCGSCDPVAPPYEDYPLLAQADPGNWQSAVDGLLSLGVRTFYLTPSFTSSELVQYLVGWNALIVGHGDPPSGSEANWLATVSTGSEQSLADSLPAVLDGQAAPVQAFGLSQVNADYLSAARVSYIQNVILELESGYIRLPSAP